MSWEGSGDMDADFVSSTIWAMAAARGKTPRGASDHYSPIVRRAIDRQAEAVQQIVASADAAEAEADILEGQLKLFT